MKKINLFSLVIASLFIISACGGETEEERQAREQARLDSIRTAQQAEVAAMMEQMRQDSIAAAQAAIEEEPEIEYGFAEDGTYMVQVGAWRSEEKAQWFIDRWADREYPNAIVVKHGTEENGDIWFRVRVGNFSNKEAANAFGGQLAAEINSDFWVTNAE